jgi:hypothetical protein
VEEATETFVRRRPGAEVNIPVTRPVRRKDYICSLEGFEEWKTKPFAVAHFRYKVDGKLVRQTQYPKDNYVTII